MKTKFLHSLMAFVAFLAVSQAGAATARADWTYSSLYPGNTDTILSNSTVTASGQVEATGGSQRPGSVKVTITDSANHTFIGTGAVVPVNGSTTKGTFTVSVYLPNAATGSCTCQFQGSTDGGQTWNAGGKQTTPTIQ